MKKIFSIVMLSGILLALVGCTNTPTSNEQYGAPTLTQIEAENDGACPTCGAFIKAPKQ
ncbi:hypothetical protein H5J22_07985 [Cetobacterium sp. 8H]|uniref:hypothetical protein n=1 Tax=Cetobacterium sp. 8H TaxID=2759681 RepID=UPI00163B8A95|nr:hypothetical protein [Cetobacterium sp. 8H]MBC2851337.1 hypothetical protein [Cetobacterium sp. 8H]